MSTPTPDNRLEALSKELESYKALTKELNAQVGLIFKLVKTTNNEFAEALSRHTRALDALVSKAGLLPPEEQKRTFFGFGKGSRK